MCSKMSTVVVYVDTQGSFSATRVKDIVSLNIVTQVSEIISIVLLYRLFSVMLKMCWVEL